MRGIVGVLVGLLVVSCAARVDPPAGATLSPWQQTVRQASPDVDTALSAFVQAIGPVPGVKSPGASDDVRSGTIAIRWVLAHWDELTAKQQAAVRTALGAPDAQGLPAVACATEDGPGAESARAVFDSVVDELGTRLWPLAVRDKVFFVPQQGDGTAAYTAGCGSGDQIKGCTIHVDPRTADRPLVIHEVVHCFLLSRFGAGAVAAMPDWFAEGAPAWVGYALTPGGPVDQTLWETYLTDQAPLSKATYSGMGFFVHMAESSDDRDDPDDPWAAIRAIAPAVAETPTTEAGWAAATPNQRFLETWGSGFVQGRHPGDAWRTGTKGLSRLQPELAEAELGSEQNLTLASTPFAPKVASVDIGDDLVVTMKVSANARGRISMTGGAEMVLPPPGDKVYCTVHEAACRCPEKSTMAGAEFDKMLPGSQWIGFTGGAEEATVTFVAVPLSVWCEQPKLCLIGTWVTTSATSEVTGPEGLVQTAQGAAGVRMTIDKTGAVKIEYTGSTGVDSFTVKPPLTGHSTWTGTQYGRVPLPKKPTEAAGNWEPQPETDDVMVTNNSVAGTDTQPLAKWLSIGISPGVPSPMHSIGTWGCQRNELKLFVTFGPKPNSLPATGTWNFERH